ncbi:mRNA (2'-O-methyladenosine-N(6)-)-methyltransferase [Ranunculus cassubicifolius]
MTLPDGNLSSIKSKRNQLEARIKTQSLNQQNLINSLKPLIPDLVSSLDLSHKVISQFNPPQSTPVNPNSSPSIQKFSSFVPEYETPIFNRKKRVKQDWTMFEYTSEEEGMKVAEALLGMKSFKEKQEIETGEEILELINKPTVKEAAVKEQFRSKGGSIVKEQCPFLTKEDCRRQSGSYFPCSKVHFRRLIAQHTDISLGICRFPDSCRVMRICKNVHYELDSGHDLAMQTQRSGYCSKVELGEAQWINCDIRTFQMDVLGQFGVIMADPPWDIHMELPYGTMGDDEIKNLNISPLQTDGLIFLWVTGRAMELGRDCLEVWGYKYVEEIIWVKTNQLQQLIKTGRTGHWLNHTKEHCLVGIKGNPEVNRNIDTDVIVSEVRETSRKPDEMYALLERISPRTRKLELFARMHNAHPGWISLGNQLKGVHLVDDALRARFKAVYPDIEVQPPSPCRDSAMEVDRNSNSTMG